MPAKPKPRRAILPASTIAELHHAERIELADLALLSAVFAALTAIFVKIGLAGVDSDFATLIRTVVIVMILAVFVVVAGKWSNPLALSARTLWFLVLSALATGASADAATEIAKTGSRAGAQRKAESE